MKNRLWYRQPAKDWNEALPVGNGRLGAMVFGNVVQERIQLNEDSLWSGGPLQRNNPDALANLPALRELLLGGRIKEAEKLATLAFSGIPWTMRRYQTLGDLYINMEHTADDITGYTRELNLDTAVVTIRYTAGGVSYKREIFATARDNVLVIRITADKPVTLYANISRVNEYDKVEVVSSHTVAMSGRTGGETGIHFCAALQCLAEQGSLVVTGEHLCVQNAASVTFMLSAVTTFRSENCLATVLEALDLAADIPYAELLEAHINDYRYYFARVGFELETHAEHTAQQPTDVRLENFKQHGNDAGLIALYFHFGRYLLISCSRPGTLPANLQGIWNQSLDPPWGSKFTININTQMNYWPAEVCNLAECHEPLFDLIKRMVEPGKQTAAEMYGCKGFTAHHNTDLWGDTAPQDVYVPATYWLLSAAWLCLHFWEHYQFGKDRDFLSRSYPVMREAAEFFVDFLIEDHKGRLVTCPSVSPENTYLLPSGEKGCLTAGATIDNQIIRALFDACIETTAILGKDKDFSAELAAILTRLPQTTIGKYGQIQEWVEDYEEAEPGHRHISHLFGLHPANQITLRQTPLLAAAARKTLERRLSHGGGHTGWSRAWIINFWARLEEGEKALENICELLKNSTLPNLFDNHPPFQIDGNFGAVAGIAEMLLQSHTGEIHLLPALPAAWSAGQVRGLRARGGLEVSMQWKDNQLTEAVIQCLVAGTFPIRYKEQVHSVALKSGSIVRLTAQGEIVHD